MRFQYRLCTELQNYFFLFFAARREFCGDKAEEVKCKGWKEDGFCEEHDAMIYHCKKTCGFCSSSKYV